MNLDTLNFFEIILSGFITLSVFRHFAFENPRKYSEFEWLGFSGVSGLLNIFIFVSIFRIYQHMNEILDNPYTTATLTSVQGLIVGYGLSRIVRTKVWSKYMEYLGKGGKRDKI